MMRIKPFLFICSGFILAVQIAWGQPEQDCDAVFSTFDSLGIDVTDEMYRFQSLLVEEGYLDGSGKGFYRMFAELAENGEGGVKVSYDSLRVPDLSPSVNACVIQRIVSDHLETLFESRVNWGAMFNNPVTDSGQGDFTGSFQGFSQFVVLNMTEEDFDNEGVRLMFLGILYFTAEDKGSAPIAIGLPLMDDNAPGIEMLNSLEISIDADNRIAVGETAAGIGDVRSRVETFLLKPATGNDGQSGSKTPVRKGVRLKKEQETNYRTYLDTYNEIKAAWEAVWDELARKKTGKPFDELDEAAKSAVRALCPLVIIEE